MAEKQPAQKGNQAQTLPQRTAAPEGGQAELASPAAALTSRVVSLNGLPPNQPGARPLRQAAVLQMQRRYGNAYVQRMLAGRAGFDVPTFQTHNLNGQVMRQEGGATGETTPAEAGEPAAAAEGAAAATTTKTLSGSSWTSQFPTSTSLDDLDATFGANVKKFKEAMEAAGATISVSATKRPPERAYLMHYAWKIVKENYDAQTVPEKAGVDINWWHGDAAKSKTAAQEMVDGYAINNLSVAPSLTSRHIDGKAIDMTISWSGELKIKKADGTEQTITTEPRDGTNADLIAVGKSYDVIHFTDVDKDKPHWSTDGK
ncbi:MAG: hypothetical protein AB1791_12485 [Chloroflexota bacterium]